MSKYIKIYTKNWVKAGDNIVKKDLLDIASGMAEWLINTEDNTYFDKENNTWKKMDLLEE